MKSIPRSRGSRKLSIPVLVLLLTALPACTTLQPLDLPSAGAELGDALRPGNVVRITTQSGEQHRFQVTEVTADAISGEGKTLTIDEIEKIEVLRATEVGKVAGASAVLVASVLFYALVYALVGYMVVGLSGL